MTTTRDTIIIVYDWGEESITSFKLPPGGVRDGFNGKETPGCLHQFAFKLGMREEKLNCNNKEGEILLITQGK